MTGENFKFLNRSGNTALKGKLDDAKSAHYKLTHINNADEFSWEKLETIELRIKHLEYEIWCEEYEDNYKRNWR